VEFESSTCDGQKCESSAHGKRKTEMKLYCLMSSKEKKVKYSSTLPFYGLTGLLLVMAPMEHVGSPLTSTSLSFQLSAPGSFLPAPLVAGNV
jgi:hypothetical protein